MHHAWRNPTAGHPLGLTRRKERHILERIGPIDERIGLIDAHQPPTTEAARAPKRQPKTGASQWL